MQWLVIPHYNIFKILNISAQWKYRYFLISRLAKRYNTIRGHRSIAEKQAIFEVRNLQCILWLPLKSNEVINPHQFLFCSVLSSFETNKKRETCTDVF